MKYQAHGLNLSSEIKFKELPKIPDNSFIHLKIIKGKVEVPSESLKEGKNFKVVNNSIYLFWEGIGDFKLENGRKIIIDINPEVMKIYYGCSYWEQ